MTQIRRGTCAHELYRETLRDVMFGDPVPVRGFGTIEKMNYITEITMPWHHCHMVPGRRWNPWLAMSEALWILAGRSDIKPLLPFNKNIASFSDDGVTNYGAYGPRIMSQIPEMIERLQKDPNDRRAVISIWRDIDLWANTKDPPCNDMLLFKIRYDRLHMTVINRSNDLHWGLYAVNIPTFGILLDWLAARLGVAMGTQTHLSNSLHVYTGGPGMKENWRITERMLGAFHMPLPSMPDHERAFTAPVPLDTLQGACNVALEADTDRVEIGIPFIEFANDFLFQYRNYGMQANWDYRGIRHAEKYQDWILAAKVWQEEGKERFK